MRTPHAQPDTNRPAAPRRLLSTKIIVLAFAAVEAVMIGWALLSGRIH
jgi:hypothetical protein